MKIVCAILLGLSALLPRAAFAQTPSPLAEWQFSVGESLMATFMPDLPKWRHMAGLGVQGAPRFEGSSSYKPGPSANIEWRYRDIAYVSLAEGIGVNLVRGRHHRGGLSATFDLGRDESDDPALHGLGDIAASPELKAYFDYIEFPVVMRVDVRRTFRGKGGVSGDFSMYMPVAGNPKFVVFVGPSVSFASGEPMQKVFGIDSAQALASGYAPFAAAGGLRNANFGVSATRFLTKDREWFVNATGAVEWLLRSAADSPLVDEQRQYALSLLVGRQW